ncbi:ProQ/FinO family protein [Ancylobacter sp. MQZ15Z-1]|uniref:ProQ/FinO family protein n=1 Tax=Ancylobacter mangrovi TaxID=2972472 RepID=A0A9X2T401_9HYPH|nr:ProQ/FinO family protein [Ancylobacter mangrovi]MCS0497900.1 ProQ/FinO family protein [Ancylobacter mangrovi]
MNAVETPVEKWRQRKTRAEATRELLVQRFPRCFMPKGQPKLPLQKGIRQAIRAVAPEISARRLHEALSDYVHGRTYLRAMTAGAARIDLDGWPDGIVSEDEAREARVRLRRADRNAARKGADHGHRDAA